MSLVIYIGNTTVIEVQDLTNSVTDAVITNATVTVTLTDSGGTQVAGQTWPLTLTHIAAGTYRATIENDISLVISRSYTATIDATVAGVGAAHWETAVFPFYRTE